MSRLLQFTFVWYRGHWPHQTSTYSESTKSPPLLAVFHWLPVKLRILFKISLLTYKTLHEKQRVYRHSVLAASLSSRSLRSSKGISLSVAWSIPTQVRELFTLVPCLVGTTSHWLSIQLFQLVPSRNIQRYIFLTLPFPHRQRLTWWSAGSMANPLDGLGERSSFGSETHPEFFLKCKCKWLYTINSQFLST